MYCSSITAHENAKGRASCSIPRVCMYVCSWCRRCADLHPAVNWPDAIYPNARLNSAINTDVSTILFPNFQPPTTADKGAGSSWCPGLLGVQAGIHPHWESKHRSRGCCLGEGPMFLQVVVVRRRCSESCGLAGLSTVPSTHMRHAVGP